MENTPKAAKTQKTNSFGKKSIMKTLDNLYTEDLQTKTKLDLHIQFFETFHRQRSIC